MLPCDILQMTVISHSGAVQQLHDIHMAVMHNILDSIGHIVTKGEGVLHLITPSMQLSELRNMSPNSPRSFDMVLFGCPAPT